MCGGERDSHSVHDFVEQNAVCQVIHRVHCLCVVKRVHLSGQRGGGGMQSSGIYCMSSGKPALYYIAALQVYIQYTYTYSSTVLVKGREVKGGIEYIFPHTGAEQRGKMRFTLKKQHELYRRSGSS